MNNDIPIFKYMSLNQFLFLIKMEYIYFTQISQWEDSREGIRTKEISEEFKSFIQLNKKELSDSGDDTKWFYESTRISFKLFRYFCYGSAWTIKDESPCMWRIYSKDKMGILIKSTLNKLNNIKNYQLDYKTGDILPTLKSQTGIVRYEPASKDIKMPDLNYFFHKDDFYQHEQEVRKVILNFDPTFRDPACLYSKCMQMPEKIYAKIKIDNFIDEIVIDPRSPKWNVDSIENLCNKENNLKGKFKGKSKLNLAWG